jgi:hypothetical protein
MKAQLCCLSTYGEGMRGIKERLTYANVTATLALFVALGGSSYAAVSLPRNSVGSQELKNNSVGAAEIKRKAVRSSEISDRSIRLRDISTSARNALHGQTGPAGPPGPTLFETVSSSGGFVVGNAAGSANGGVGVRLVAFSRSLAGCVPLATLTAVPGGANPTPPAGARIRTETSSDGRAVVRTFDESGVPTFYPFNLVAAC